MRSEWLALAIAVGAIIVAPILWRVWLYLMFFVYVFLLNISAYSKATRLMEVALRKMADEEARG